MLKQQVLAYGPGDDDDDDNAGEDPWEAGDDFDSGVDDCLGDYDLDAL